MDRAEILKQELDSMYHGNNFLMTNKHSRQKYESACKEYLELTGKHHSPWENFPIFNQEDLWTPRNR